MVSTSLLTNLQRNPPLAARFTLPTRRPKAPKGGENGDKTGLVSFPGVDSSFYSAVASSSEG